MPSKDFPVELADIPMAHAALTRAIFEALHTVRNSSAHEAERFLLKELPRLGGVYEDFLRPKVGLKALGRAWAAAFLHVNCFQHIWHDGWYLIAAETE